MFVSLKKEVTWPTAKYGDPILGIRALHLPVQVHTHSSEHTHTPWTHTREVGNYLCCGTRGAVGGSVPCSEPQSWYWRWREHWTFTPPTKNPCRNRHSNSQPFDYESDSLTIRPRIPHNFIVDRCGNFSLWELFSACYIVMLVGGNVCTNDILN